MSFVQYETDSLRIMLVLPIDVSNIARHLIALETSNFVAMSSREVCSWWHECTTSPFGLPVALGTRLSMQEGTLG